MMWKKIPYWASVMLMIVSLMVIGVCGANIAYYNKFMSAPSVPSLVVPDHHAYSLWVANIIVTVVGIVFFIIGASLIGTMVAENKSLAASAMQAVQRLFTSAASVDNCERFGKAVKVYKDFVDAKSQQTDLNPHEREAITTTQNMLKPFFIQGYSTPTLCATLQEGDRLRAQVKAEKLAQLQQENIST